MHPDRGPGEGEAPDTDAALRAVRTRQELVAVLLAADLYMPTSGAVGSEGRARRLHDAAAVRYPVLVEGDERLVPVFTTEAAVLSALPEPDRPYIVARGAVLLAGWPPDASLYLNPGAELSTKVPGERLAALREEVLRSGDAVASDASPAPSAPVAPPSAERPSTSDVQAPDGSEGRRRPWVERLGLRRRP